MRPLASRGNDDSERDHTAELRPQHHAQRAECAALPRTDEIGDAPRKARAQREQQRSSQRRLLDGASGGDRVELVRVVEDGSFSGSRRTHVVMRGDAVEQLGLLFGRKP